MILLNKILLPDLPELNLDNYQEYKNFKTSGMGPQWPALRPVPTTELKSYYNEFAKRIY